MMLIQQLFPLLTFSVAAAELIGNKVACWPADMVAIIINSHVSINLQQRFA
jgi:hypothetical protein